MVNNMKANNYLADLMLDWLNDWLTVKAFADYHNVPEETMRELLLIGKALHEQRVKDSA